MLITLLQKRANFRNQPGTLMFLLSSLPFFLALAFFTIYFELGAGVTVVVVLMILVEEGLVLHIRARDSAPRP